MSSQEIRHAFFSKTQKENIRSPKRLGDGKLEHHFKKWDEKRIERNKTLSERSSK